MLTTLLLTLNLAHAQVPRFKERYLECHHALSESAFKVRQTFAGHLELPSGTRLFVRIQQPRFSRPKSWFMLVHGLLDSHRAWDEVAHELLQQGHGVLRMDLRGFARSLELDQRPPKFVGYRELVGDLKELLLMARSHFQVVRPRVAGHSLGGGLTLALLRDAEVAELIDSRAIVIAPYIYRLEYYLAEKFAYMGLPLPNPLLALDRLVPDVFRMGPEYMMDTLISEPQMRFVFTEFFERGVLNRDLRLSPEEVDHAKHVHVQTAIATVKGLREFNALNALPEIPDDIRVDLVFGSQDPLVERRLAQKLAFRINQRGGLSYELDVGHMILQDAPTELARILTEPKK